MSTITGVPGVSSSPSMMAGDESLLFSGGTYAGPPSRSPSASTLKSSWTRAPRRFNSSSTQQKAQEKAQEALASAQKGLEKALEAAKKASGTIGERAGNLLGCAS